MRILLNYSKNKFLETISIGLSKMTMKRDFDVAVRAIKTIPSGRGKLESKNEDIPSPPSSHKGTENTVKHACHRRHPRNWMAIIIIIIIASYASSYPKPGTHDNLPLLLRSPSLAEISRGKEETRAICAVEKEETA